MDKVERIARALMEWDLGLTGDEAVDAPRYSDTLSERRAAINRQWTSKREQAEHIARALGEGNPE